MSLLLLAAASLPFNNATGGTETTVSNYNGTGETWKVHSFTSTGTLSVTKASQAFAVLVVGAGASGTENGGNGAQVQENLSTTIASGDTAVTVGVGTDSAGSAGGNSSLGAILTANGGSGTGSGNTGGDFPIYNGGSGDGGANTTANSTGASGQTSSVSGTSTGYGGGGGGGALNNTPGNGTDGGGNGGNSVRGQNGAANRGGGGGGGQFVTPRHGIGGSGVVVVAYQIG